MAETLRTQVCIAGGGPAGMMAGLLFARAGVETLVLEKHADFLRDFRGDTVHPSTLELFHELGLLDDLLARPHQRITELAASYGGKSFRIADLSHLPTTCRFIALMPQWDLLDFVASAARAYPPFALRMETEVTGLIERNGRIAGVTATRGGAPIQIESDLVLLCSGRGSALVGQAGLAMDDLGAPIDVLWFRVPKSPGEQGRVAAHLEPGTVVVTIDRRDYYQAAYVVAKGEAAPLRARDIADFRRHAAKAAPELSPGIDTVQSWDDVKTLTVQINRLRRWSRPGLLAIGDAAHAMSPIGGVGINLAVQDAVASANALAATMARGGEVDSVLHRVRDRRMFATRLTQRAQIAAQNGLIAPTLAGQPRSGVAFALRLLDSFAPLRRLPARLVGLGVRPEHVESPAHQTDPP